MIKTIQLLPFLLCYFVSGFAQTTQPEVQKGHISYVFSARYSPDGKMIATGSADKTIKLWDVANGKLVRTIKGHTFYITSLAFSPNGKQILSGSWDKTARLWDVKTGRLLKTFTDIKGRIYAVAFSPDGTKMAAGGNNGLVNIREVATGKILQKIKPEEGGIKGLIFSPDGTSIAAALSSYKAQIWEVKTGKLLQKFTGHTWAVQALAYTKDGKKLVTGSRDKSVRIWDVSTGKLLKTLKGHTNDINAVAFTPDGQYVISGSDDKTVRMWRVSTGKQVKLFAHPEKVQSIDLSPSGKELLTGIGGLPPIKDNMAKLWNISSGKLIRSFHALIKVVTSLAFSPDGNKISAGLADGSVKLLEIKKCPVFHSFHDHTRKITKVGFTPDNQQVLSSSKDQTVCLMDVKKAKTLWQFGWETDQGSEYVNTFRFAPDGSRVILGFYTGEVIIRKITGSDIHSWFPVNHFRAHTNKVKAVAFSSDQKTVYTAASDGYVKLWNATNGKLLKKIRIGEVSTVSFSPDNKIITTTNEYSQGVGVMDLTTEKYRDNLTGHTHYLLSASFTNDSRKIVSNSLDNTSKLWDVKTGGVLTLKGHNDWVVGAASSPNDQRLLTMARDGTIKLWETHNGRLLGTLYLSFENKNAWLIITPEGTYEGNKAGLEYLNIPLAKQSNYKKGLLKSLFQTK